MKRAREYGKSKRKSKTQALWLQYTHTQYSQTWNKWFDSSSMLASHLHASSSSFLAQAVLILLHTVINPLQWNDNNIIRCTVNMSTELFVDIWFFFCRVFLSSSLPSKNKYIMRIRSNLRHADASVYMRDMFDSWATAEDKEDEKRTSWFTWIKWCEWKMENGETFRHKANYGANHWTQQQNETKSKRISVDFITLLLFWCHHHFIFISLFCFDVWSLFCLVFIARSLNKPLLN